MFFLPHHGQAGEPQSVFMHQVQSPFQQDAIELKGSALTVVVVHLKTSDPRVLYPQLEEVIDDAGGFLASAPVVIDVALLGEQAQEILDFSYLCRFLRGAGLMPVGVQGAGNSQKERISQAGLLAVATAQKGGTAAVPQPERASQESGSPARRRQESAQEPASAPRAEERGQTEQWAASTQPRQAELSHGRSSHTQNSQNSPNSPNRSGRDSRESEPEVTAPGEPALVITQPVRAGQQVSAPNGDLIVLASVNAGSELFAAGNIHVYGTLRGRALAGVYGDTSARIFTLQGNPELLAIAGEYVVNEELPRWAANQSFAVSWSDSGLRFQVLGSFAL